MYTTNIFDFLSTIALANFNLSINSTSLIIGRAKVVIEDF